jgi:two-component system, chemotaxis family, chemotaxis protein CheY
MLQATLERFGYEVTAVKKGNEAVASYRQRPADLVITDLIMPDKEGRSCSMR